MNKQKVLFVCVHNSARSQMAEAYLNLFGGEQFEAESAGLEPGNLNPFVIEVMKEDSVDISGNKTKSVFDFFKQGRMYGYLITVCDETEAERCPIFPGVCKRIHWSFPDPSLIEGSSIDKLNGIRIIRDQIKEKIKSWIIEVRNESIKEGE